MARRVEGSGAGRGEADGLYTPGRSPRRVLMALSAVAGVSSLR